MHHLLQKHSATTVQKKKPPESAAPFFAPRCVQRKCAHCEEEEKQQVQRKEMNTVIQKWNMDNAPIGDPERDVHLRQELATATPGLPVVGPSTPYRVCSRELQGSLGAVANHAFVATPASQYAIITRCKPTSGNDWVVTGTAATKTDASPDPCGKGPTCVECRPRPGVTNLDVCLRNAFTAYADPSLYRGLGPNSNTFAGTLARACCDNMSPQPAALGTVPGWDDPPAPGRAATCPPGGPVC
ncbi:hypothetical protein [Chitinophaga sp. MM2321]|uniref:hypothetical protein n=1 Tax=Chitinophaga sp. MM2321 TaxID=3137178 RepID=UPI0032D59E68